MKVLIAIAMLCTLTASASTKKKKPKEPPPSALDQTLEQLAKSQEATAQPVVGSGSLWSPAARFADLGFGHSFAPRGRYRHHCGERKASAVSSGTVKPREIRVLQSSITAAGGITRATGPLANLAKAATNTSLDGQGTTTRDTTLTTTLSAFVMGVLPNGNLLVQGVKNVGCEFGEPDDFSARR